MSLTESELKKYLNAALDISQAGGNILKQYWGKISDICQKDHKSDLVTEADKASEEVLIAAIHSQFPSHGILAEESGLIKNRDNEFLWVIDPLDGTTNYTHQYPFVCVSVGLLHRDHPIIGIVYNPITEELFSGAKGLGAKLNNSSIHVSKTSTLEKSLLSTGFPYDRNVNKDNNYAEFATLTNLTQGVRRAGAAALDLSYVACGRLDGFWERGLQPWDVAAGIVLIEEAGGKITKYDGSTFDIYNEKILVSNGIIHQKISKALLQ